MTEEEKVQEAAAKPVSEVSTEHIPNQTQEAEDSQDATVPRSAYLAERRKRQEHEEKNRLYEEYLLKMQAQQQPPVQEKDPDEWLTRREVYEREKLLMDHMYKQSNPEKVEEINLYLEAIAKQKPWVRQAIASSETKYATAYDIVQDYKYLVTGKKDKTEEAQKIVQNAQKPGSPTAIAKSAQGSKSDYLLGIRGTPEFKKYRQDLRKGR